MSNERVLSRESSRRDGARRNARLDPRRMLTSLNFTVDASDSHRVARARARDRVGRGVATRVKSSRGVARRIVASFSRDLYSTEDSFKRPQPSRFVLHPTSAIVNDRKPEKSARLAQKRLDEVHAAANLLLAERWYNASRSYAAWRASEAGRRTECDFGRL